jgi:hypothetical protein
MDHQTNELDLTSLIDEQLEGLGDMYQFLILVQTENINSSFEFLEIDKAIFHPTSEFSLMVLLEELGHDNAEITKLNFFIRIAKDGID